MNFIEHPHGRMHMGMHHLKRMLHQDILNRCMHPMEAHRNFHRIVIKVHQYEVMLRPLLFARATGKMTEKQFHNHLRSIEDQITDELQLPMRRDPHHIKPDMINHDGSTCDMDNGHEGWATTRRTPLDKHHFKHHRWFSDKRNKPHIHDLSARMHLAAFATLGDDDDIHHFQAFRGTFTGLARSNNVEIADDYDFNSTPYPNLPIENQFTQDGEEEL